MRINKSSCNRDAAPPVGSLTLRLRANVAALHSAAPGTDAARGWIAGGLRQRGDRARWRRAAGGRGCGLRQLLLLATGRLGSGRRK